MMALRPYQRAAIDAAYTWCATNDGNPLIVVPTGGGKSLIMGTMAKEAVDGSARVLVIAHRKELIEQNWKAMQSAGLATLSCGLISGQHKRKDAHTPATVGSIQTLAKNPFAYGPFDLVLIDECHLVPRSDATSYRKFLDAQKTRNPNLRTIGLTATPFRLDSGRIDRGEDRVFHDVAYEISIQTLLDGGFLVPLISKATLARYDVTGVAMRGGEYVEAALQSAVDDPETTKAVVAELGTLGKDRSKWLVFCAGVQHAEHMAEELTRAGFPAAAVHGGLSAHERTERLLALRSGTLRALTNCDVLTTGYDEPSIDLLALCRPTASTGLHVQMLGRGFRTAPGKTDCIAEGQPVLTDHGLVPIEKVTLAMRVWDGEEFVTHHGVVYRGVQEVIEYAGLTATSDHRVWTPEGWKTVGQCSIEQTPLAVTELAGRAIREADGHLRRSASRAQYAESADVHAMCGVRERIAQRSFQSCSRDGRMSTVWTSTTGAQVASHAGDLREATLHQPEGPSLCRLRRTRRAVRLRIADLDGLVGHGASRAAAGDADRQNQQRRAVRSGEPSVGDARGESAEHPQAAPTHRRVYDILNCGPRHRFTVSGVLVHNCLVLDFSGNCLTHGPVDALRIKEPKKKGEGPAPAKACPTCHEIVGTATRVCPRCGFDFPPPAPVQLAPSALLAPVMAREKLPPKWWDVTSVEYSRHEPKDPAKKATLRVDYKYHFQRVASEWVCIEHDGFAQEKARTWWADHLGGAFPGSIAEALERAESLEQPVAIALEPDGKFERVVNRRFAETSALHAPAIKTNGPCFFCTHWDDLITTCTKYHTVPPNEVRLIGCESFADADALEELPF